jgi:hypothetical protein
MHNSVFQEPIMLGYVANAWPYSIKYIFEYLPTRKIQDKEKQHDGRLTLLIENCIRHTNFKYKERLSLERFAYNENNAQTTWVSTQVYLYIRVLFHVYY